MIENYNLNDIVQMKKNHPCGKTANMFKIVRMGVDIKIKCLNCGNVLMLDRLDFERKAKKLVEKANTNEQSV